MGKGRESMPSVVMSSGRDSKGWFRVKSNCADEW